MDLYCLLGNPVEHSRSPQLHNRFAELTGEALRYEKRLVPLGGFDAAVAELRRPGGARGCNVTLPFKLDAARIADHTSERARLAGAVNVLSFREDGIHADNSDGIGLVADIERNAGRPFAGQDVLIVGAGGAGAGVLGPILNARPRSVVLVNRTRARADAIAARHAELAARTGATLTVRDLDAIGADFDIVINATSTSIAGGEPPMPASVLRRGALACDLMYGPKARGFMDWASAHGAEPRDGLGMLVEQAAEAFFSWRGVRPPTAQVLAEVRATL